MQRPIKGTRNAFWIKPHYAMAYAHELPLLNKETIGIFVKNLSSHFERMKGRKMNKVEAHELLRVFAMKLGAHNDIEDVELGCHDRRMHQ